MAPEVFATIILGGAVLLLGIAVALVVAGWYARGRVADKIEGELAERSEELAREIAAHGATEQRWRSYVATLRRSQEARDALGGFGGSDAELFDRVLRAVEQINGAETAAPARDPEADHRDGAA